MYDSDTFNKSFNVKQPNFFFFLSMLIVYLSIFCSFINATCLQKREAPAGEKPELVKTHLRNMIIVPEMIGSVVGVYNGKTFNQIEIKPEMIGTYLAEYSISYKPVKHGRPGIGATHSSRFIPLKWEIIYWMSLSHLSLFGMVDWIFLFSESSRLLLFQKCKALHVLRILFYACLWYFLKYLHYILYFKFST